MNCFTFENNINLVMFCTAVAGLILLLLFYLVVQVLTFSPYHTNISSSFLLVT